MKKYELTNEYIIRCGRFLYRIRALKDFSDVKKGDLGGYVEKEENLSQKGDCWVYDNARVYEDAKVCGNAEVFDCRCTNIRFYNRRSISYTNCQSEITKNSTIFP